MSWWGRVDTGGKLVEFVGFVPAGKYHPDITWAVVPEYLEGAVNHVPLVVVNSVVQPASLDALLAWLLARLAAHRYGIETGGVRLADGSVLRTGRANQAMVKGLVARMSRTPDAQIDFKGASGWQRLGKDQVEALADALDAHVQACFSREQAIAAALTEARAAGDALALVVTYCDAIDEGWPKNALAVQAIAAATGAA